MAQNAIRLVKGPQRIDMRGDNRLPGLLDQREKLRVELKDIQDQLKEIDTEVRSKLGDAQQMITDGWLVNQTSYIRGEYTVPATTIRRMSARRTTGRIHKKIDDRI